MDRIGRYEIAGEIGRGAMGRVLRAIDPAIGRTLAIKLIRLSEIADPAEQERLRERMAREARSAGALSHPHIVTIYDAGQEGELAFIAMEYVEGETLADRLESAVALTPAELTRILAEIAAALDYAHSKGVVHRDVKPANIILTAEGSVKITDFGIAKFGSQQLTSAGTLLGTPSYMSPEQIDGTSIDGRADQFSLAVIAYEMLTGEKPFQGDSLPALLFRIVREQPVAPHLLNPDLSEEVSRVMERAMRKAPDIRYPTCSEFQLALRSALGASPGWRPLLRGQAAALATVEQPRPEMDLAPVAAKDPARPAEVEKPQRPAVAERSARRRRLDEEEPRRRWKAAVLFLALAGGAAAAYHYRELWIGPVTQLVQTAAEQPASPEAGEQPVAPSEAPPVAEEKPSPMPVPETREPENTGVVQEVASPQPPRPIPAAKPIEPPGPGLVEITSQPSGARISIDNGAKTCQTPCPIMLDGGQHFIMATLDGYRRATRMIDVPDVSTVNFALDRMTGTLMVRSNPPGASITLDGKLLPQKTPAVLNVTAGRHKLELRMEGRQPYEEEIEVKDQVISNIGVNW